jgi:Holliday junction resolvasome RuvABC DNA-binding subunit
MYSESGEAANTAASGGAPTSILKNADMCNEASLRRKVSLEKLTALGRGKDPNVTQEKEAACFSIMQELGYLNRDILAANKAVNSKTDVAKVLRYLKANFKPMDEEELEEQQRYMPEGVKAVAVTESDEEQSSDLMPSAFIPQEDEIDVLMDLGYSREDVLRAMLMVQSSDFDIVLQRLLRKGSFQTAPTKPRKLSDGNILQILDVPGAEPGAPLTGKQVQVLMNLGLSRDQVMQSVAETGSNSFEIVLENLLGTEAYMGQMAPASLGYQEEVLLGMGYDVDDVRAAMDDPGNDTSLSGTLSNLLRQGSFNRTPEEPIKMSDSNVLALLLEPEEEVAAKPFTSKLNDSVKLTKEHFKEQNWLESEQDDTAQERVHPLFTLDPKQMRAVVLDLMAMGYSQDQAKASVEATISTSLQVNLSYLMKVGSSHQAGLRYSQQKTQQEPPKIRRSESLKRLKANFTKSTEDMYAMLQMLGYSESESIKRVEEKLQQKSKIKS